MFKKQQSVDKKKFQEKLEGVRKLVGIVRREKAKQHAVYSIPAREELCAYLFEIDKEVDKSTIRKTGSVKNRLDQDFEMLSHECNELEF